MKFRKWSRVALVLVNVAALLATLLTGDLWLFLALAVDLIVVVLWVLDRWRRWHRIRIVVGTCLLLAGLVQVSGTSLLALVEGLGDDGVAILVFGMIAIVFGGRQLGGGLAGLGLGERQSHQRYLELAQAADARFVANPKAYFRRLRLLLVLVRVLPVTASMAIAGTGVLCLVAWRSVDGGWPLGVAGAVLSLAALLLARAVTTPGGAVGGVPLGRGDAPELFRTVRELADTLQVRQLPDVLVVEDANAGQASIPRLGGLAGTRHALIAGLPYLQMMTAEQFRAVVVHELAHQSGRRSRLMRITHDTKAAWLDADDRARAGGGGMLAGWIARWYAPWLAAWATPLERRGERDADEAAMRVVGAAIAAEALVVSELRVRHVEENVWRRIVDRIETEPLPPRDLYTAVLRDAVREGVPASDAARWLRQALAQPPRADDPHPSLSERLQALGIEPTEQGLADILDAATRPVERSAAEALLGEHEWHLAAIFDDIYYHEIVDEWRERHQLAQQNRSRIIQLQERRAAGSIPREELVELACLLGDVHDTRTDIQVLREAEAVAPDHPKVAFCLGAALLESDDEEGILHLERAMRLDPRSTAAACRSIVEYLDAHGRRSEAQRYRDRMDERIAIEADAEREREQLHPDIDLSPHQLADDALRAVREHAARAGELRQLHLWKRPTEHLPDESFYILGISFDDDRYDDLIDAEVHPVDRVMSKLMPALEQHMIDAMPIPLNEAALDWMRDKRDETSLIYDARGIPTTADITPTQIAAP